MALSNEIESVLRRRKRELRLTFAEIEQQTNIPARTLKRIFADPMRMDAWQIRQLSRVLKPVVPLSMLMAEPPVSPLEVSALYEKAGIEMQVLVSVVLREGYKCQELKWGH